MWERHKEWFLYMNVDIHVLRLLFDAIWLLYKTCLYIPFKNKIRQTKDQANVCLDIMRRADTLGR